MSNELAIAAVTKTLRYLLLKEFADLLVDRHMRAMTPEKIDDTVIGDGLVNLFLYHVDYDPALANMAMQGNQLKPAEAGFPPVPLALHYMVTAYGKPKDQFFTSHRLLGKAISTLHDHPVLGVDEIEGALAESELHQQIERVRITRERLSIDEMSKLWTTFQTNYRISVAYQVSAVLIESARAPRTPLPVLSRGPEDSGVRSQSDLTPPYPTLTEVAGIKLPEKMMPTTLFGGTITLKGFHLDGMNKDGKEGVKVTARFSHQRLDAPIELEIPPAKVKAEEIEIKLPADQPAQWPVGIYSVLLLIKSGKADEQDRTTNELAFVLAA